MDLSQALFLARVTSYWRFYLCSGFLLLLRLSFTVLFGGYFLSLVLLLLGLMSAKSHPHVQLIRAELSSRSSSEPLSESSSKLSSHQIPRCLRFEGPLQLKGCTRSSTLFSSTTPLGASVLSAFFSHSALRFDFGVEQACSAAARVLLACPSRASPSSASGCLAFLFYGAFPHAEVRRLRIHVSCGSALPSSGPTSSFLSSSMRVKYLLGGGRMCFPDRDCRRRPESHCIFHRSCLPVPRSLFLSGRPDEFSQSRLSTSTSPLLHSTILLISTSSSCASVAWMEHCLRGGDIGHSFRSSKGGSVGACALVCAVLHPRARTQETGQATPGVTVACLVFWKSSHQGEEWPTSGRSPRTGAIVEGRGGLGFQRNLELAFSNLSAPAVP